LGGTTAGGAERVVNVMLPAPLRGVIETALYVDDLAVAVDFYATVCGLEILDRSERFCAFSVGGRNVLLLFRRHASTERLVLPGGVIPGHDGAGPLHFAFAVDATSLAAWEQRLSDHNVTIEGRMKWDLGGASIYFRDPDGHLVELVTPGTWRIY
jgi:catechol 2,3-dioxygenase-like lactoylglutathione lyase family enzyme